MAIQGGGAGRLGVGGQIGRRVGRGATLLAGLVLMFSGAAINLATLRPTQAEPVWAAVATGKYPPGNGVRSAATYRVKPGGAPRRSGASAP